MLSYTKPRGTADYCISYCSKPLRKHCSVLPKRDPRYLGAMPGIISVLHTWGQCLSFHPHIHCIVSGGGMVTEAEWKHAKKTGYHFLFPVKAMSIVYRAKFLQALRALIVAGEVIQPNKTGAKQLLDILYKKDWIVYAQAPLAGPHAVIEYLLRQIYP